MVRAAPAETLASPVPAGGETRDPSNPIEVSPPPSHPEDAALVCPTPPLQDAETPASFSPPAAAQIGPPGPEGSVPQQPPVPFQASHQITKALFAPKQQIQPPVSQVQVQVQVQLARSSVTSPAPLQVSVSVPQQQPRPPKDGDDPAAQQHKQQSEFQPPLPPPHKPPPQTPSPSPSSSLQSQQLPWKRRVERLLLRWSQPVQQQQPRDPRLTWPRVHRRPAQPSPARRLEPRSDQDPEHISLGPHQPGLVHRCKLMIHVVNVSPPAGVSTATGGAAHRGDAPAQVRSDPLMAPSITDLRGWGWGGAGNPSRAHSPE